MVTIECLIVGLCHGWGLRLRGTQCYNCITRKQCCMKKHLTDLTLVVLGNFILALGVQTFVLPYEILSGGVAGIAVAISRLTGISSELLIILLIGILFVLGSFFLGRKFTVHTALSSVLYPLFLSFLSTQNLVTHTEPLLASLYGGLIAGLGVGLVFRTGASTGGMDVPPMIIHKYTHIDLAKLVLVTDLLTVLLGWYVYGIEAVLIGFISVWATSFAINKVLLFGGLEADSVMIVSQKHTEIIAQIHDQLDRGSTLLSAQGGFSHVDRPVILTVIYKRQYPELIKILAEIDPTAFIIVTDAKEVKGNGFSFDYRV